MCVKEKEKKKTQPFSSTEPMGSLPRMQLVLADRGNDRGSRLKKGCHKPCTHQDFSSPAANEKTHRHTKKKNNRDVCVFNTAFTPSAWFNRYLLLLRLRYVLYGPSCAEARLMELLLTLGRVARPGQVYSAAAQVFRPGTGRHHLALIADPQRTGATSIKPPSFSFQPVCVCVCVCVFTSDGLRVSVCVCVSASAFLYI